MHSPQPLQIRLDAARKLLPTLTAKFNLLPTADRKFLGELPEKVRTLTEIFTVEKIAARIGADKPATAPKPAASAPVAPQATAADLISAVTNPATRGPAVQGLRQSVAARLGLKETQVCTRREFSSLTPAQKMQHVRNGGKIQD